MKIPKELKYTNTHEWVKLEGDEVRVGITDYAQQELGEVVYVELPDPGSYFEQFAGLGVVESVKSVSEIYAPMSGKIIEVNRELFAHPQIVNQDPYEKGWMMIMKVELNANHNHELDHLMGKEEYENQFGLIAKENEKEKEEI